MLDMIVPVLLVGGLVVLGFIAFLVYVTGLNKVPPNEAHVIVGMKDKSEAEVQTDIEPQLDEDGKPVLDEDGKPVHKEVVVDKFSTARVVIGDRYFRPPFISNVTKMSLEQRSTEFAVQNPSKDYIDTHVAVNVQFRIGNNPSAARRAASRFAGQQDDIPAIIGEAMAGNIRSIVGTMTVAELFAEREKFKQHVLAAVTKDFKNQGIYIDTLNIKNIKTVDGEYLENLSKPETEARRRAAELAQQEANLTIAQNLARTERETAAAQRELAIAQAQYDKETREAQIEAEREPRLRKADQDRLVAEKERDTQIAPAEAERARLLSTVVEPAKAEAEARKQAIQADAEARKQAAQLDIDAEAYKVTAAAAADQQAAGAKAAAVRAAAEAEAAAIRAKGDAEAEATEKKANAASKYSQNALQFELVKTLPQMVEAAAKPLSSVDNMQIISTDGANKLVGTSMDTITQMVPFLKNALGVDLSNLGSVLGGDTPSLTNE